MSVAQAESRFSIEGQLADGTDVMDIPYILSSDVISPDQLVFCTWSHSGGTNNAGDVIVPGGFDPTLTLLDEDSAQVDFVDDGTGVSGNFDSLLIIYSNGVAGPPAQGDYALRLEPLNDSFGSNTKDWAVDLTGPSNVLSLDFRTIDLVAGSAGISKVSVTGAGSKWNNSGGLFLGGDATTDGGAGTLNINSGGRVQVGDDTSTFNISEIIVSDSGAAANLVVRHGSTITNPGIAVIGASAGHTGSATVTGAGSQ